MKSKIIVSFLVLLFIGFWSNKSYGQMKENEENLSDLSTIVIKPSEKEKIEAIENKLDFYLKKPVTLYFKNGDVLEGYLIPNLSENPDIIFVEINGKYKSINFTKGRAGSR